MFEVKLQAVKERLGLNIKSGRVMIETKDRDWMLAIIENLSKKINDMEQQKIK